LAACALAWLAVSCSQAQTPAPAPAAPAASLPPDCGSLGDLRFVCGPDGPEDLVAVPGTSWLVSSAFNADGGLFLVDTVKATSAKLFPIPLATERFDTGIYGSCPGPLQGEDRASFRTHGLDLKAGPQSTHTLYAVHHGGRESIEVFTLDVSATPPAVSWIGCVVAPDPIGLNAVVALPDGGFAVTNYDARPPAGVQSTGVSAKVLSGDRNGEVWEWHPKGGWVKVPGSEASGANGIALSDDGNWYYVAQWGNRAFMRLSRGKTPVERTEIPVGFRVDNLRWARDGRTLLAAGQESALSELSKTTGPVSVIGRIDPQAMTYTEILKTPVPPGLFAATVAVEMAGDYWVGSFRGVHITRYPIPAGR
jgi:hypothetical protein